MELPSIFQDAIRVARKLNIRYLWIDALCILQDWFKPYDEQFDWIRESAKMGQIFSGSLVTFCAAHAVGNEGGLFNENSHTAFENPEVSFDHDRRSCYSTSARFERSNGETSVLHFVDRQRSNRDKRRSLKDNCLNRRVWCCQENLLSPRKIYYCRDQLCWHCDHIVASEDRLVDAAEAPFSISPSLQGLDNLDPHATSFATRVSEYWHGSLIARGYSRHETTYEKDRLIAVSGLARRVGAATNSKYLAGLWQSTLTHNLSWEALMPSNEKTGVAPSWSWASQTGGFNQRSDRGSVPACTLLRDDIVYINPQDVFGGVARGALTLRGRVFDPNFGELPLLQSTMLDSLATMKYEWDDDRFGPTRLCVSALLISTELQSRSVQLLLPTPSASDSGEFVWIGRASIGGGFERDYLHWLGMLISLPEKEIVLV
jgi:hypothetical protein